MRDIRARIAKNHGIELTAQQIQELAARRIEAILDPRTMKPGLLDQLRKGAGVPRHAEPDAPLREAPYTFDDTSLYESHRGLLRFIRSLLKPILKLFFNPAPLVVALKTQVTLNAEAAVREDDRDRRQAEWNALHYELLQRVVTETARVSIEMQSLSMRVESLSGKVDFNERRVRAIEGASPQQSKPAPRPVEPYAVTPPPHRGRRSGTPPGENVAAPGAVVAGSVDLAGGRDSDTADEDDDAEAPTDVTPAPLREESPPATSDVSAASAPESGDPPEPGATEG
jgi:hypothetical protein